MTPLPAVSPPPADLVGKTPVPVTDSLACVIDADGNVVAWQDDTSGGAVADSALGFVFPVLKSDFDTAGAWSAHSFSPRFGRRAEIRRNVDQQLASLEVPCSMIAGQLTPSYGYDDALTSGSLVVVVTVGGDGQQMTVATTCTVADITP